MNQQERDELREKHKPVKWNNGFVSCDVCNEIIEENYYPVLYPCDVIKMLDATEYPHEGQNVECDTWLGSHPHQARSRLHQGLDLTTVTTTTALSVERNYE